MRDGRARPDRVQLAANLANEFASLRLEDNIGMVATLPAKWALRLADIAIRDMKAARS